MEKKAFFQQLDERTDIRYTDSGMKIIRLKFPRAHLRLCNVKIDFGSRDVCLQAESGDTLLPYGTAHFLEHLLFWHNGRNLYSDFFAHGALLNAFTTYTDTNFMFTSLPDRLRQTIPILLNALWNHSFDKKMITQEKAVITSEIQTAHLNHQLYYHYQLISMLSPASPAAVFPAGRIEDIEALDIRDLQKAYNAAYQPQRMTLFLIGGSEDTEALLPPHLRLEKRPNHKAERKIISACPPPALSQKMVLGNEERMEDTWTGLQVGAIPGQNDLLTLKLYWDIASRILFQLDSPFFQEIQQTYRLEIDRLSAEAHMYEDGGFLILHSQGAHSSAYIDVASYYVTQQKQQIEAWLQYGKDSLTDAIIYDSDYVRKCFEWAAECDRCDCTFLDMYRIIHDMNSQDFLSLIDALASSKKAVIHVSQKEAIGQ
ncbi:insulinase family protein [Bacillus spizizenii]|uniref:Insulinase family protein n=1 Tax=Bacillus spizizenii TaxID=96241 RepID=A0A9Q4DLF6_BACSC|nr:pitrilysin family protein [Bacillus spizizenii]KFI02572.1 peptidase M16 [Bacillus sp. BSC154]MCY7829182.1 insulinase family protein [Bacillus spizizenii]MCY7839078.1 insulinase family protein [Bacillus spizizenii]MCY7886574.1 insulinase family protein [Bacillus spizizenii]MCY8043065.1 insulinase family protein [Bacillus spizizenii]